MSIQGACENVLEAIGNTPLVKLRRIGRNLPPDIYVKCEYLNPAGSMKDRMTLNLVNEAEKRGELRAGGTIIEATSGNTGAGLAMIAAVRGYRCVFVMPDKMSHEKIAALRAFGARVVVCPAAVEPEDPRSYYSVAKRMHAETGNSFYANQYHNPDNPGGHYLSTGPELWEQTRGQIDVFVAGLGTGGTISGTGRYLKEHKPEIQLVGVDPVGSLYYDLVKSKRLTRAFTYKVEGIGEDFVPTTFDPEVLDEIERVDDKECFLMTRDLVRLEGLYAGGSSGAAVAGAVKYARSHPDAGNIVVLLPDGAAKYLSKIFSDEWMRENGFLDSDGLGTVADLLAARGAKGAVSCKSTERLRAVVGKMKTHGISQLPVVEDGKLLGAVSEVDLLRYLAAGEHSLDSPIGPLVESDYATVTPQTKLEFVQSMLSDVHMLVVLEGDAIAGIVTKIDLIDYLMREHRVSGTPYC